MKVIKLTNSQHDVCWFPQEKLIQSLESELVKLDELTVIVEDERARRKLEEPEPVPDQPKEEKKDSDDDSGLFFYHSLPPPLIDLTDSKKDEVFN